jgi:hypothetical protein
MQSSQMASHPEKFWGQGRSIYRPAKETGLNQPAKTGQYMKLLFTTCPNCASEVEVQPLETEEIQGVACHKCGASFSVANAELKEKKTSSRTSTQN